MVPVPKESVTLHVGDCRAVMARMDADSMDCVVTSPPYWGLRDYGVSGQLGMEPTLTEHITTMVDVFAHVWRVLKPGGVVWLNYGDCYATSRNGTPAADAKGDDRTFRDKPFKTTDAELGIKTRDLCMIPSRLAIALQEWGWHVRSEVTWAKPNAMPDSSGNYRPSQSSEKLFLLAKESPGDWLFARDTGDVRRAGDLTETERAEMVPTKASAADNPTMVPRWRSMAHYYDARAVRIATKQSTMVRLAQDVDAQAGSTRANGGRKRNGTMKAVGAKVPGGWDRGDGHHGSFHRKGRDAPAGDDKQRGHSRRHAGFNDRWDGMTKEEQQANGRLLRNCEPAPMPIWTIATSAFKGAHFATFPAELALRCILSGCPARGVVLDPFGGAGTTGLVAMSVNRRAVLIELNPEYAEITKRRLRVGLAEVETTGAASDMPDMFGAIP